MQDGLKPNLLYVKLCCGYSTTVILLLCECRSPTDNSYFLDKMNNRNLRRTLTLIILAFYFVARRGLEIYNFYELAECVNTHVYCQYRNTNQSFTQIQLLNEIVSR
jgi:hypothetical protein